MVVARDGHPDHGDPHAQCFVEFVVDPQTGADLTIIAKVGAVDGDTARIDLTVSAGGTTVLGKAQVRVRLA